MGFFPYENTIPQRAAQSQDSTGATRPFHIVWTNARQTFGQ